MISVTPEAIERFKQALGQYPIVRLGVRGSGCNGYSYVIEQEYEHCSPFSEWNVKKNELLWMIQNVKFVVDQKSAVLLEGCTLTWAHRGLLSGFEFVNPREASRCGCGASFTLKTDS